MSRIATNDYERKLLANIATHGWQCTSVAAGESSPSFSYTIGLYASFKHPELIIFGLRGETAHGILGVAANAAAAGTPFDLSRPTDKLIAGYSSAFVEVPASAYDDYVLSATWYYGGNGFPLFQVVWPSAEGNFPWHPDTPESFRRAQPVLGQSSSST